MAGKSLSDLAGAVDTFADAGDARKLKECAIELEIMATEESAAHAEFAWAMSESLQGRHQMAISRFEKAVKHFTLLGNKRRVARSYHQLGFLHGVIGDHAIALSYNEQALELYLELADKRGAATASSNLGFELSSLGRYSEALDQFNRAVAMQEELGNSIGVANATLGAGNVYSETGNYPEALTYFHRALELYEEHGDLYKQANVHNNIGIVCLNIGNTSSALEHYAEALSAFNKLQEPGGIARATGNIGVVHWKNGDYSEARACFEQARDIHHEQGDQQSVARFIGNLVTVMIDSGQIDEAITTLETLDSMLTEELDVIVQRERSRASIFRHQDRLDDAEKILQEILALTRAHSMSASQTDVHRDLRELALKRNDLAGYVEHNNAYTRIMEEINGRDTATRIAMQDAERSIARERQEHERQMAVLHSALPKHIADRVARGEQVTDHYDLACVIFLDIVGFTSISDQLSSDDVVQLLESVFTALDAACKVHDVVKIKTIGDSYMAVAFPDTALHIVRDDSGIPVEARHIAERTAHAAIKMLDAASHIVSPSGSPIRVRLGVHCGPLTAGVIGTERLQFDVWGDTVNVTSRLESTSEPGRIHVSDTFASLLTDATTGKWHIALRGDTDLKGKGTMTTHWLESL